MTSKSSKVVFLFLSLCAFNFAHQITPRISNGDLAQKGQFPYYAYLQIYKENSRGVSDCGGALIKPDFVLTAAHCLENARSVFVHLGATLLPSSVHSSEPEKDLIHVDDPKRFHIYPDYGPLLIWNDVALIHLSRPAKLSKYIAPIELPSDCSFNENLDAVVMGFGRLGTNGPDSKELRFASLQTTSMGECRITYPLLLWRRSVICAKSHESKIQAICKGDSGSPLVSLKDNKLIGVASFGRPNCDERRAQAFSNIVLYHQWITRYTGLSLPKCK